ncbi:hypothetical protein [Pseudomonas sp. M30-35]|uniref:hypothetical protein n=1 Tax=Pseudomonas sp. M30-35 TaxID=1981174 RepID=UPI000B3BFCA8|nr:hypothetical protein [Pseudomonas sp. M30-35]ARU90353.1 hypothetical protein B9K09_21420 [Pseudomonas sp. M30-35]
MSDIENNEDETFAEDRLIEAVENQIEAGEPAAARATLNKLTLVGYDRDEILQLMAQVLAYEVNSMLEADQPFNLQRYESGLRALPELPE